MKKLFYMFLAVMYILISSLFAKTPKLEMPVEIKNIKIINVVGNNVLIEVEYLTKIDNGGILSLNVSDNIELLDKSNLITKNKFETVVQLVKDMTVKKQFGIKQQEGTSLIHFNIEIPDSPPGYKRTVSKDFKIIRKKNSYSIYDPRNPGDSKPKELGKDIIIIQGTGNTLLKGNTIESLQNYSVSISGKIEVQYRNVGLYGNGVALWFRNSSNPGSWYHPVYSEDNILHTHYDIIDEQGNFNFNFNFTGDLSGYNQAIIIVNTANDAANLPAPEDGYVSWGPHGFTKYFNESEGVVASINGSNPNITINQNGVVNYEDGSVLRYLQLAREFVVQRYGGSLPFSLPNVSATIEEMSPAGEFRIGWWPTTGDWCYIAIDPSYTEFSTVSHEYGHYVNYRMWGGGFDKFADAETQLKEGWAIFYSFATRNYGNVMYSDPLYEFDDNTEEAPFQDPRYDGIRYTSAGHPDYGAAASLFWSLYDSYNNDDFEVSLYNGDNDDITDYSIRLFDKLRTLNNTYTVSYINHFANGLNSTVNNSVSDIVTFMFADLYEIPSHRMKPAQVNSFSSVLNNPNQVIFNWNPQSYSGSKFYGNYEAGYKLYKNIGGSSWQLLNTFSYGTNSYIYDDPNPFTVYKITSYNSSGEALNFLTSEVSSPPSPPSSISSNTTLSEGVWMINENTSVTNDATLIIEPGAKIFFTGNFSITINSGSNLQAVGNQQNPITFTRNGTTGNWNYIKFNSGSHGTISYANIEYAKKGIYINQTNGVTIENSTIEHFTEQGIYSYYGAIDVNNCIIRNPDGASYGIYLNWGGTSSISGTQISGISGGGAGLYDKNGEGEFSGGRIKNCSIGLKTYYSNMEIYNSYIHDNGYGIRIGPSSSYLDIHDNDFYSNNYGIYLDQGDPYEVKWNNFGYSGTWHGNLYAGIKAVHLYSGNSFLSGKWNNFYDGDLWWGAYDIFNNSGNPQLNASGNHWEYAYTSGNVNTASPQSLNQNAGPGGSMGKESGEVIAGNAVLPRDFKLEQNFPNPFNPSTVIRFHLPEESNVTIEIYDMLGHVIKTLTQNTSYQAGIHSLTWNGKNEKGDNLSSGVYFYRIHAVPKDYNQTFSDSRKLVYIR